MGCWNCRWQFNALGHIAGSKVIYIISTCMKFPQLNMHISHWHLQFHLTAWGFIQLSCFYLQCSSLLERSLAPRTSNIFIHWPPWAVLAWIMLMAFCLNYYGRTEARKWGRKASSYIAFLRFSNLLRIKHNPGCKTKSINTAPHSLAVAVNRVLSCLPGTYHLPFNTCDSHNCPQACYKEFLMNIRIFLSNKNVKVWLSFSKWIKKKYSSTSWQQGHWTPL